MYNPFTIMKKTEAQFGLPYGTLTKKGSKQEVTNARSIAIYLTVELTKLDLIDVADHFCREKSTVVYAHKKITDIIKNQSDSGILHSLALIKKSLGVHK